MGRRWYFYCLLACIILILKKHSDKTAIVTSQASLIGWAFQNFALRSQAGPIL
jgi:hypothetical protein